MITMPKVLAQTFTRGCAHQRSVSCAGDVQDPSRFQDGDTEIPDLPLREPPKPGTRAFPPLFSSQDRLLLLTLNHAHTHQRTFSIYLQLQVRLQLPLFRSSLTRAHQSASSSASRYYLKCTALHPAKTPPSCPERARW